MCSENEIADDFDALLDNSEEDKKLRLEWLKRLHIAVDLAESEPFSFIPRSAVMQDPIVLND